MSNVTEYTKGLRDIADFIDAHPELGLPSSEISCYSMDEKKEAAMVLKAAAPCKKAYSDSLFVISKEFGPLTMKYYFNRKSVCTPRVVGVKVVPATPERVIQAMPEHVVEIIEWDCEPILSAVPQEEEVV